MDYGVRGTALDLLDFCLAFFFSIIFFLFYLNFFFSLIQSVIGPDEPVALSSE